MGPDLRGELDEDEQEEAQPFKCERNSRIVIVKTKTNQTTYFFFYHFDKEILKVMALSLNTNIIQTHVGKLQSFRNELIGKGLSSKVYMGILVAMQGQIPLQKSHSFSKPKTTRE